MKLNTRVFELYKGKHRSSYELARVMGISLGYIYNVRQGTQSITQKFIIGVTRASPGYKLDDLFYGGLTRYPSYVTIGTMCSRGVTRGGDKD